MQKVFIGMAFNFIGNFSLNLAKFLNWLNFENSKLNIFKKIATALLIKTCIRTYKDLIHKKYFKRLLQCICTLSVYM